MSKITIDDIKAQFASVNSINQRFKQVMDEFNSNVLYRKNPVGEPNGVFNDVDMQGFDLLNIGEIYKDGEPIIIPDLTWGNIGGNLEDQTDLYPILVSHEDRITDNEQGISDLEGANFQDQIDAVDTELGAHTSQQLIHIPMDDNVISAGSLYSSNKIEQLVLGALIYEGNWDAATNTPTLSDATGTGGRFYVVSIAGTQDLGSGNISFNVGDTCAHNGTVWQRSAPASVGDAASVSYDPSGNLVIQPISNNVDLALTDLDTATAGKEEAFGNPTVDGHTLASTIAGVRSWVPLIEGPAGADGAAGTPGEDGDDGAPGTPGLPGNDGTDGTNGIAATVDVGDVTKVPAGGTPTVVNTGDTTTAIFDFGVVTGDTGPQGDKGDAGTGLNLLGQEAVAVIITLTALAIGDAYVSTTAGLDSEGTATDIDDVVRATDTAVPSNWVTIGPLQGPQGDVGPQGAKGDTGDTGLAGADGTDGTNGTDGAAATIAVGTVTGVPSGTPPDVVNSGTPAAAVFDFTLEKGATGTQGTPGTNGTDGEDGAVGATGPDGTAATIAVGQVVDVVPGGAATVVNVGTPLDAIFDFGIVTGDTGAQGIQGEVGPIGPAGGIATDIVYDPVGDLVIAPASLEVDAALANLDTEADRVRTEASANTSNVGAVTSDLIVHEARIDNPHAVTAGQAGADTSAEVDAKVEVVNTRVNNHELDLANPHAVTATQAGADTSAEVDAKVATKEPANANIQAHITDTANPHGVTAAQAGAPAGSWTWDGTTLAITVT